jgi:hypothetical protein
MSDERPGPALTTTDHLKMATLARSLAHYLMTFARERRDEDRKRIAELQTELCVLYRKEQAQVQADEGTPV